jgi:hypothetical protein
MRHGDDGNASRLGDCHDTLDERGAKDAFGVVAAPAASQSHIVWIFAASRLNGRSMSRRMICWPPLT